MADDYICPPFERVGRFLLIEPEELAGLRRRIAALEAELAARTPIVSAESVTESLDVIRREAEERLKPQYYRCKDGTVAETRELVEGSVFADYDAAGECLGVEVLGSPKYREATWPAPIPCGERMPEPGVWVMIFNELTPCWERAWYTDEPEKLWATDRGVIRAKEIAWWMPLLPEPPDRRQDAGTRADAEGHA